MLKKIIVEECIECPCFTGFDDPPGYCNMFSFDIDYPIIGVHEKCQLDDQFEFSDKLEKFLDEFYPNVKKSWEVLTQRENKG